MHTDEEYSCALQVLFNLHFLCELGIGVIHKFVRDNYAKRFPELEQLVLHPLDYIRTVKVMQNQMDCTHLDLSETIAPATIMVVSVTASTTQGYVKEIFPADIQMFALHMLFFNRQKN